MSLNPFLGALVVKIYHDLVTFHGFFTFRLKKSGHPNAADQNFLYTNLIISSEKLIFRGPLLGRLRETSVPALDF